MSLASPSQTGSLSVAFEPRKGADDALMPPGDFSNHLIVHRILTRFSQPLIELGRRAQRVGPVDRGTILLLTGISDGVGSSTLALALAAAAAADGPAALVDADFRSQGLTHLLIGRSAIGWEDVVSGVRSIQEAVRFVDSREALAFFPIRAVADDFSSHQGHSGLTSWLGRLRQDYPLIILDSGPVHHGGVRWAPWVDSALIVRDPTRSADSEWTRAWDSLEEAGTHVLGIVETFV
jgi:Mrp family chromosome partitioning ATPase